MARRHVRRHHHAPGQRGAALHLRHRGRSPACPDTCPKRSARAWRSAASIGRTRASARTSKTSRKYSASTRTRRLVFNALIGNGDAHLKNWSVIYPDGRTPRLSPAHDLVSTIPYIADDRLALSIGRTRVFAQVDMDRIERFAMKAELPVRIVVNTARDMAARIRDAWPTHEPLRLLPDRVRAAIEAHMATVPL